MTTALGIIALMMWPVLIVQDGAKALAKAATTNSLPLKL